MISTSKAKEILNQLCKDFNVPSLKLIHLRYTNIRVKGEYYQDLIAIYGNITMECLLHEFAHHVHEYRTKNHKQSHNLSFFRICFEIRDYFQQKHGVSIYNISGYNQMTSYKKALTEWLDSKANCQYN